MPTTPIPTPPPDEITVNELIREVPLTIPVFNSFGIDSCCGGGLPLKEAAQRHGLDVNTLLAAVANAGSACAIQR